MLLLLLLLLLLHLCLLALTGELETQNRPRGIEHWRVRWPCVSRGAGNDRGAGLAGRGG